MQALKAIRDLATDRDPLRTYTITEACTIIGMSRWTFWRMAKRGELKVMYFGTKTRVRRQELDEWQRSKMTPPVRKRPPATAEPARPNTDKP